MKLSLALLLLMSGCAAPKKRPIAVGCISRIEIIKGKPCEPEKDGIHADCLFRVTYGCIRYK
jgi:hypothetical protein